MIRYHITLLFLFFWSILVCAQKDYKGKVIDASSSKPIPFVNIGIVDKGVGTVSDEDGLFHLYLNPEIVNSNDNILFSSLGYEPRTVQVSKAEYLYNEYPVIKLKPSTIALQEVVVTLNEMEFVDEMVGYRKFYGSKVFGYWKENMALGGELGTRIMVKKGFRKLNSMGFEMALNEMDSVLLRINIYDRKGKNFSPKNNLNKSGKNILHKIRTGDTFAKIDLRPYGITVEDDFNVSIELIKVFGNKPVALVIPAISNDAGSFRRYASQDNWTRISDSGMGYFLDTSLLLPKDEADQLKKKLEKKNNRMNKVSGFVLERGRMLSDVHVINRRTKESAMTDFDGRYVIYAKPRDILCFDKEGYDTKCFKVTKKTTLNANLEPEQNQ